jgi:hypothetical protein
MAWTVRSDAARVANIASSNHRKINFNETNTFGYCAGAVR